MKTKLPIKPPTKNPKYSVYAALDLHSARSVLGGMDHDGGKKPRGKPRGINDMISQFDEKPKQASGYQT